MAYAARSDRNLALQIAISRDLEVASRVLLTLGVLPAQVPPHRPPQGSRWEVVASAALRCVVSGAGD